MDLAGVGRRRPRARRRVRPRRLARARRPAGRGHRAGCWASTSPRDGLAAAAEKLTAAGLPGDTRVMDAETSTCRHFLRRSAVRVRSSSSSRTPRPRSARCSACSAPAASWRSRPGVRTTERWAVGGRPDGSLEAGRRARSCARSTTSPTCPHCSRQPGSSRALHRLEHRDVYFADADAWWDWKWSYSLRGVLEQQDGPTLDRLSRQAAECLRPHQQAAGIPCRLTANLVRARRPGSQLVGASSASRPGHDLAADDRRARRR